jgi:hypothetical protein
MDDGKNICGLKELTRPSPQGVALPRRYVLVKVELASALSSWRVGSPRLVFPSVIVILLSIDTTPKMSKIPETGCLRCRKTRRTKAEIKREKMKKNSEVP